MASEVGPLRWRDCNLQVVLENCQLKMFSLKSCICQVARKHEEGRMHKEKKEALKKAQMGG